MTLRQDLTIQQGATFEFKVQVVGGPASLTGGTARMQVRPLALGTEVYLDLTTGAGLTIDAPSRIITISVSDEDTALLDWMYPALYDLELTVGGMTWRVMEGTVTLSKEVTR